MTKSAAVPALALLSALAALQACSLPTEGLSSDAIAGLECGRARAGYVDPQPEGCYRSVVRDGCFVVVPGDQCATEAPDWYVGGEPYEVWCDAWRELERDPVALKAIPCPE